MFPDEGADLFFLGGKLFQTLHIAFVKHKNPDDTSKYALAFPGYSCKKGNTTFGGVFRVFAESREDLEELNLPEVCHRFRGYIACMNIKEVSEVKGYQTFSRGGNKHFNVDFYIRRASVRKNISIEEAAKLYENYSRPKTKLPYFMLRSWSTEQSNMMIYIAEKEDKEEREGLFNLYGLSVKGGGNTPIL